MFTEDIESFLQNISEKEHIEASDGHVDIYSTTHKLEKDTNTLMTWLDNHLSQSDGHELESRQTPDPSEEAQETILKNVSTDLDDPVAAGTSPKIAAIPCVISGAPKNLYGKKGQLFYRNELTFQNRFFKNSDSPCQSLPVIPYSKITTDNDIPFRNEKGTWMKHQATAPDHSVLYDLSEFPLRNNCEEEKPVQKTMQKCKDPACKLTIRNKEGTTDDDTTTDDNHRQATKLNKPDLVK